MTPEQRKQYHFKWDRFQRRQELIYTTKFKKALQEQVQQYKDSREINAEPIYKVLVDLYTTVGPLWAHQTQVSVKRQQVKARQPMGFSQRIVDLMRQYYQIDLINDAELMTRFSREVIANVLSDAAIEGLSIPEIVRKLEVHPDFSQMRARRIARTETVTAANGAADILAKESGVDMYGIWFAVHDKRTRHDHMQADNQKVALNDPFNVGGELLDHPGARKQRNGLPTSAKNVVNCRCVKAFEVIK